MEIIQLALDTAEQKMEMIHVVTTKIIECAVRDTGRFNVELFTLLLYKFPVDTLVPYNHCLYLFLIEKRPSRPSFADLA